MRQGVAQKRRLKNFLAAKEAKSGRLSMLPPPPEDVVKKGRKQASSDMPRSLQRMLQLKALAEKRGSKGSQRGQGHAQSTIPIELQQEAAPEAREGPSADARVSPSAHDAEAPGPSHDADPSGAADVNADPSTSDHPTVEHATAEMPRSEPTAEGQKKKHNGLQPSVQERQQGYARKGLKEKKKEFLKNRKLKKKGGRHGEEADLEAQLAQDPHKPKFGEQAMAPIKVNLKRKHWDPNASQGRASKRCTQIFEQQLANARQQSSSQKVAQPVTSPPRGAQQGRKAGGKKALKQWQLKKEKASQQAAQGAMQASAIEAYRSLKRPGNGATVQSLKALVREGAEKSAQQAAS